MMSGMGQTTLRLLQKVAAISQRSTGIIIQLCSQGQAVGCTEDTFLCSFLVVLRGLASACASQCSSIGLYISGWAIGFSFQSCDFYLLVFTTSKESFLTWKSLYVTLLL